jgi:hypothetical protein
MSPARAAKTSGRREWFSIVDASSAESANTHPSMPITVTRLPERVASSSTKPSRSLAPRIATSTTQAC